MTEVQAAEVIHIVLRDQRIEVLREVLEMIVEQREAEMGRPTSAERIEALNAVDARINTLIQRGG